MWRSPPRDGAPAPRSLSIVRRCVLWSIVAVTTAPAACGSGTPVGPSSLVQSWPSNWSALEQEVLLLVNQRRASGATCGSEAFPPADPLSMQPQLRTAARDHSLDMAEYDYFSHTSPDGRTFADRIREAGYSASPIGENIAVGYTTPQAVMDGWMGSPGHCRNIMRATYRTIGVGYAHTDSTTYRHYWTQDFGGS